MSSFVILFVSVFEIRCNNVINVFRDVLFVLVVCIVDISWVWYCFKINVV